jgi:hypothetical protein
VPEAKDDVLAAAVLDQAPPGSLPAGTEALMAALPKHFPITVSMNFLIVVSVNFHIMVSTKSKSW